MPTHKILYLKTPHGPDHIEAESGLLLATVYAVDGEWSTVMRLPGLRQVEAARQGVLSDDAMRAHLAERVATAYRLWIFEHLRHADLVTAVVP